MDVVCSESEEEGILHEVDESVASEWADVSSFKGAAESVTSYRPSVNESMVSHENLCRSPQQGFAIAL